MLSICANLLAKLLLHPAAYSIGPLSEKSYCFCIAVLKSDLMAALNEEVKSLDEDNWKFEGPRSRIHLISRPGYSFNSFHTNLRSHFCYILYIKYKSYNASPVNFKFT